jgi:quercetin dioxygenase-like cupin family protein
MVTIAQLDFTTSEKARKGVISHPQALVNFMHLQNGQELPRHQANGDMVYFVLLGGKGIFDFDGTAYDLAYGQIASVPRGTEMHIRNVSAEPLDFLVIKTPNPENK